MHNRNFEFAEAARAWESWNFDHEPDDSHELELLSGYGLDAIGVRCRTHRNSGETDVSYRDRLRATLRDIGLTQLRECILSTRQFCMKYDRAAVVNCDLLLNMIDKKKANG